MRLILDLGANAGAFSLLCAKLGCDVIAVEAQSGFQKVIEDNLARNHCAERVRFVHGLVGSHRGVFAKPENLRSASHFGTIPPEITAEGLLRMVEGREVALMKIDIEGSEFGLFQEDTRWLRFVRRIAMEVHPDYGIADELVATLRRNGLECWLTDGRGHQVASLSDSNGFCYAERHNGQPQDSK